MSGINATDNFESYRLDVEARDDCHLQRVYNPTSGAVTWQTWTWKRHLGQGAFGEVRQEMWEDENSDVHYRAVKSCSESRMRASKIDYKRELSALAAFSKSEYAGYFVHLHGWWIISGNIFVAMEYLGRGDLSRYAKSKIPEVGIMEITDNILRGLEVMHRTGFTHRDIKPQNILVYQKRPENPRWWVKIADFGISKQVFEDADTVLHTTVGTRSYCAPEVLGLLDQHDNSVYDSKVDIWSLGCVLFNLASHGQSAFSERDLGRYCDGRIPFNSRKTPLYLSDEGQALIELLLATYPSRRPTATLALQHAWLSKTGIDGSPEDKQQSPSVPKSTAPQNHNSFPNSAPSIATPLGTQSMGQQIPTGLTATDGTSVDQTWIVDATSTAAYSSNDTHTLSSAETTLSQSTAQMTIPWPTDATSPSGMTSSKRPPDENITSTVTPEGTKKQHKDVPTDTKPKPQGRVFTPAKQKSDHMLRPAPSPRGLFFAKGTVVLSKTTSLKPEYVRFKVIELLNRREIWCQQYIEKISCPHITLDIEISKIPVIGLCQIRFRKHPDSLSTFESMQKYAQAFLIDLRL